MVAILCILLSVNVIDLTCGGITVVELLVLPLLALVEMAAVARIASLIISFVQIFPNLNTLLNDWRSMLDTGWIRSFTRSPNIISTYLKWIMFAIYLACEELLFRGLLLNSLLVYGELTAILISSLLFAAVQCIGMPSWRHAIFPVSGAIVMGPLHGYLVSVGVPI